MLSEGDKTPQRQMGMDIQGTLRWICYSGRAQLIRLLLEQHAPIQQELPGMAMKIVTFGAGGVWMIQDKGMYIAWRDSPASRIYRDGDYLTSLGYTVWL